MDKPVISYDKTSDTLSISFEPGVKATGIELNDHILLRINKEARRAVGITFLDYSIMAQKADFGPRSFPLTGLSELSVELREMVVEILVSEPVKAILALSTFTPSYAEAIPITFFNSLPLAAAL
jgi:uncharacterized protein YuzE